MTNCGAVLGVAVYTHDCRFALCKGLVREQSNQFRHDKVGKFYTDIEHGREIVDVLSCIEVLNHGDGDRARDWTGRWMSRVAENRVLTDYSRRIFTIPPGLSVIPCVRMIFSVREGHPPRLFDPLKMHGEQVLDANRFSPRREGG